MCSGVRSRDSVVGLAFRYAAALYGVRFSVGARYSLFVKIRLHVPWSQPSLLQWVLGYFVEEKPSEQGFERPQPSSVRVGHNRALRLLPLCFYMTLHKKNFTLVQ